MLCLDINHPFKKKMKMSIIKVVVWSQLVMYTCI